MIPTDLLILAYLLAQGGAVNSNTVRAFLGNPTDFDMALGGLTSGRIVASNSPLGNGSLDIALAPTETETTILADAQARLSGAELMVFEEYLAAAGGSAVVNPFRDDALAAGLTPADARLAAHSARLLALRRQRRIGDPGLLLPGARAAAVADKAAVALT